MTSVLHDAASAAGIVCPAACSPGVVCPDDGSTHGGTMPERHHPPRISWRHPVQCPGKPLQRADVLRRTRARAARESPATGRGDGADGARRRAAPHRPEAPPPPLTDPINASHDRRVVFAAPPPPGFPVPPGGYPRKLHTRVRESRKILKRPAPAVPKYHRGDTPENCFRAR